MKDEEKFAIEFTRKSGHRLLFNSELKKYKEEMIMLQDDEGNEE